MSKYRTNVSLAPAVILIYEPFVQMNKTPCYNCFFICTNLPERGDGERRMSGIIVFMRARAETCMSAPYACGFPWRVKSFLFFFLDWITGCLALCCLVCVTGLSSCRLVSSCVVGWGKGNRDSCWVMLARMHNPASYPYQTRSFHLIDFRVHIEPYDGKQFQLTFSTSKSDTQNINHHQPTTNLQVFNIKSLDQSMDPV